MFIVALSFSFNSNVLSEESAKDIIKKRKSLFSQNYKLAKRISILLNEVEIEMTFEPPWSKDLMSEEAKLELGLL